MRIIHNIPIAVALGDTTGDFLIHKMVATMGMVSYKQVDKKLSWTPE